MAKTIKKTAKKTAAKKTMAKKAPAKKTAGKKKVAKKTTAKKVVARKKVSATNTKRTVDSKKAAGSRSAPARRISAHERRSMISEAAYLRGEALGFLSDEREDWLLAEAEIDAKLTKARVEVTG